MVPALIVLVTALLGRPGRAVDLECGDDCGWCGGRVRVGVDYCSDYCREADARECRAWERRESFWEVDAPDGHVVYLGPDLVLASELHHSEPAGAQLHLTPRPAWAGGWS